MLKANKPARGWNIKHWITSHETKKFFKRLAAEKDNTLDELSDLEEHGDELTKRYHGLKGKALGMTEAYELAELLAREEKEEENE